MEIETNTIGTISEGLKFLIVDDSKLMRELIKDMVRTNGDVCVEAADGAQAIVRYVHDYPDCVLMDIKMEKLDGIVATEVIKKINPKSKVVIVSHYNEEKLRNEAAEAGADAFVLKDNLSELNNTIRELCELG